MPTNLMPRLWLAFAKWPGITHTKLVKYLAKCSYYTMSTNLMPRLWLAFAKWPGITHTKLVKYLAKCSYYTTCYSFSLMNSWLECR